MYQQCTSLGLPVLGFKKYIKGKRPLCQLRKTGKKDVSTLHWAFVGPVRGGGGGLVIPYP